MVESNVWIVGGYQSDFARNLTREGQDYAETIRHVVCETLASARVRPDDVEVIHMGNAFGQLFAGQGQLGAMPASVIESLWGVPSSRHEAACASGGVAVLAGIADLRAGAYDCALVVGVELERMIPGTDAAAYLGAASWVGHEAHGVKSVWPHMFNKVALEYERRYGLDPRHLRSIASKNFANARTNPNAQGRDWNIPDLTLDDDLANPVVDGVLRRYDCSPLTDGGAGIVLVTDGFLNRHPGTRPIGLIRGWGHRTVGLSLQQKLSRDPENPYVLPHLRLAVLDAFRRARVMVDDVHGFETHDCFTPSEYAAIDHIGITGPGESWKAIEEGALEIGGRFPLNPSGGLIGGGHPVGASGIRMVLDAAKQVSGTAGANQVEGAKIFGTLNFGGSTTTTISCIVGAVDA